MKTKVIGIGIAAVLGFASYGPPAAAADRAPVTVNVLSAPFGTGTYVIFNGLEQISKEHPWLRIVSSESPGFVYNYKKLASEPELQETTIIGSGPAVAALAQRGEKPFNKKYPGIKLLANYTLVAGWLATLDPDIKTVKDLQGKKVALGRAPQINWAVEPKALITVGYGIPADEVNFQYVGTKEAVAALLDGTVDAAVVGGYLDTERAKIALSPQTMEFVASGRTIFHLGFAADAVTKTVASGMPLSPFTLPANSFDGLNEALPVSVDNAAWVASPNFPEDLAYEVTKLIIDNVDRFGEFTAVGKLMSRGALTFGWPQETIHPGALRAYKEAGIIK